MKTSIIAFIGITYMVILFIHQHHLYVVYIGSLNIVFFVGVGELNVILCECPMILTPSLDTVP